MRFIGNFNIPGNDIGNKNRKLCLQVMSNFIKEIANFIKSQNISETISLIESF